MRIDYAARRKATRVASLAASLAMFFSIAGFNPAQAEVFIDDPSGVITIDSGDSSLAEVLDALGVGFHSRFREVLEQDLPPSPTYSGETSQILARLLERYDYIATSTEAGQIELLWIKRSARSAGVAPARRIQGVTPATARMVNLPPPPWRRALDKRAAKHEPREYTLASVGLFRDHCRRTPLCRAVFR
jgi:hypothetical protein